MGRVATKAVENIYYQVRKSKAETDDRFSSRDKAAELMGVHPSTLAGYELGTVKCPTPDMVVVMSDAYNAPELLNHYCSNDCPIGCGRIEKLDVCELDRIALKTLSSLQDSDLIKKNLLEIVADGKVTEDEEEALKSILEHLDTISKTAQELKLWVQKNIDRR